MNKTTAALSLLTPALLFCASARAAEIAVPALAADELVKLKKGEVIIHRLEPTDGKGVAAKAMGVVEALPQDVWPVVRDCFQFQHFMPRTKKSELRTRDGGPPMCFVEISMPFPLPNLWSESESLIEQTGEDRFRRTWKLVKGSYGRNNGSWTVLPFGDDKKHSLLLYAIDSDPSMPIPGPILRAAQTGALPDVFVAVRKRVETQNAARKP